MATFRVKFSDGKTEEFEASSYELDSDNIELKDADDTIIGTIRDNQWAYIYKLSPDPFTTATKQAALSP